MARKSAVVTEKYVDPQDMADALARAVIEGDIVSFRTLFLPFSPGRKDSTEAFEDEKYAYLLPDDAMRARPEFSEVLSAVQRPAAWKHIEQELEAKRPAQLPSDLLLSLADAAVRLGKFTSASQAYELLRIRQGMQDEYLRQADEALDAGDIPKAVLGYRIGTGLGYDYAAFPEPLPKIPRYQSTALILHGVYPQRPEDSLGMQPPEVFLQTALSYLLDDPESAAHLLERPMDVLAEFLQELVRQIDPEWEAFRDRYRDACEFARDYGERLNRTLAESRGQSLADEVAAQQLDPPVAITERLLGRSLPEGAWWQYLKELAYAHPASALFIARQFVGDKEILVPRVRANSPIIARLELVPASLMRGE